MKKMTMIKRVISALVIMGMTLSVNIYGQSPVGTVETASVYNGIVYFEGKLPDY